MLNWSLNNRNSLQNKAEELFPLVQELKKPISLSEKIQWLRSFDEITKQPSDLAKQFPHLESFSPISQVTLLTLFAIGQKHIFPSNQTFSKEDEEPLKTLLDTLNPLEEFYTPLGGIAGYHFLFLQLLIEMESDRHAQDLSFYRPPGVDLTQNTLVIRKAIRMGIEKLPEMGEIYPVAGAGDRLDLHHETTGEPLPAAELNFLGYTLLEGLIRDLEGREYLYYKLFGKSITTPLVLMTSHEKNNDHHVHAILERDLWFERGKENFYFILQPLAPVIGKDGLWIVSAPLHLFLKPGGHGALWKLALKQGAISWLQKKKREKVLVRQINNPVAGVDHGLLALAGIGCKGNKLFGFASCDRLVKNAEGMDVLIEKKMGHLYEYLITNVEYTDFEKFGIQDTSRSANSPYSQFPANTNILFVNLKAVEKAVKKIPFPGMTINTKEMETSTGEKVSAGRLEFTMQNIADAFAVESSHPLTDEEKKELPTFVTYNARNKTISTTKKQHVLGKPIQETPQGAFYTVLSNHYELLKACGFTLPPLPSPAEFLEQGPSFFFSYHPALGPLYAIISQKLHSGSIKKGGELKLEIAEIRIESLDLDGSLLILADKPTGKSESGFSLNCGKCILKNIKVENKGLNPNSRLNYWKQPPTYLESLLIQIEGNGEFIAENICFKGNFKFTVPDGHQMRAVQEGNQIKTSLEKIKSPSWTWTYQFDLEDNIHLSFL